MSEIDKSMRLHKVAKELNIGTATITDYLKHKGFKEIENKPTAKVTDEMYDVLLKEFQGDKSVKEESKQINIGKIRRDEVIPKEVTTFKRPIAREEVQDEILIKNLSNGKASAEYSKPSIVAAKESVSTKEDVAVQEKDERPHLKIVGKINLNDLNPKTRDKSVNETVDTQQKVIDEIVADKIEEEEEKKTTEQPNVATANGVQHELPQTSELVAESAPDVTSPEEAEILAPVKEKEEEKPSANGAQPVESQRIDTIYQKLTGPSIIGKISLPVDRKSSPVASSNAQSQLEQAKKKRKRKETPHPTGQHNTGSTVQTGGDVRRTDHNRPYQKPPFRPDNRPKVTKAEPTDKEIQDQIKATLARLSGAGKSGKFAQRAKLRRQKRDDIATEQEEAAAEQELQSKVLKVTEYVTANELASLMDVPVTQIISTCMALGLFVSINQRLDAETLTIVADEFGFQVSFVSAESEVAVEEDVDDPANLVERAPIVTVMGHVDHGKTSLLDYVRRANVIAGEAGGITQHIGAYEVQLENGKRITFLDTPGHEAFTAMRARGAKSTDIVIIVIAADDSVMPQTVEAINHAQAAGVPMVFAFNKMDRDGANADKIREQLANMNILVEEWGGKYQTQEISARKGTGVDLLLEKVLLEAELLELKANPNKRAVGVVIEAALDKGRGITATVLIQGGTLRVGDPILAGCYSGRVKAMFNERQQKTDKAGPSVPVMVLGMQGAPQAGDKFVAMESEVEAREIANKRLQLQREQGIRTQRHITLDEIGRRLAIGNFKELNVIIKGDVDGSIEALSDSLLKLSTPEIQVNVLHKSVGQISESDVLLASASDAIIIGFQVRPSAGARKLAEQEQIDIRLYSIIYDAINELKSAMEGMLSPVFEEKIVANIEIRETFKISKVGTIAGCYVLDGKINRNTKIRIVRDGVVIHSGELDSLKRFKDDVKEVSAGYECGLNIKNFNDIQQGDIIEGYEQVEVKRKL